MCDPITIAGIALTGASTVANSIGQRKVDRARDDALAAERIRQSGLDKEADALNTQSQDRYENFDDQEAARSTQLGDYFQGQSDTPDAANAAAAMPTSTSNVTIQEEAKQRAKASAFTDEQGTRLGDLRAFGDVLGSIGRNQARDAMSIGQIGGFKRGSASILPNELDAANSAGAGARFLGDVLGGAGSIATSAGVSGFGGDTIANSLEIKMGADPWRGLRSKPTSKGSVGLGRLY